MKVIKKDGTIEQFDGQKIVNAVSKSAARAMIELDDIRSEVQQARGRQDSSSPRLPADCFRGQKPVTHFPGRSNAQHGLHPGTDLCGTEICQHDSV